MALLVLGTANLLMVISPWTWLMDFMGLYYDADKHMMFRVALLLMVATHMVLSYGTEVCVIKVHFIALPHQMKLECKKYYTIKVFYLIINVYIFVYFKCLAGSRAFKKCFQWVTCKREPKNKYKLIHQDMEADPNWPPMSASLQGL